MIAVMEACYSGLGSTDRGLQTSRLLKMAKVGKTQGLAVALPRFVCGSVLAEQFVPTVTDENLVFLAEVDYWSWQPRLAVATWRICSRRE